MMKKATIIVNIMGIIDKRYKKPKIKAMEHANSPKMAKLKEREEPTPKGAGKTADNS